MNDTKKIPFLQNVLKNMPTGWISSTTHRLDVYNEKLAKVEFLEKFDGLYKANTSDISALNTLPTAYDYIRLGHPLSCILEWGIASLHNCPSENIISFSSQTIPILAILRKNRIDHKKTRILHTGSIPSCFNPEVIKRVYGYHFKIQEVDNVTNLLPFEGTTLVISEENMLCANHCSTEIDFFVNMYPSLGSVLVVCGKHNQSYISEIQHVRRRETIAMTPEKCIAALQSLVKKSPINKETSIVTSHKKNVLNAIKNISNTETQPIVGSSGLSVQYAIMMGLIDEAHEKHQGKDIKFIVPPNCYGGTNDQARRVAACVKNVEVVDLPVDGNNNMVTSIDTILEKIAKQDAIPYIIAEIPTNPRVEVPNLKQLKGVLEKKRFTTSKHIAIDPVFILDQTFCPNVHFLGDDNMLAKVRTISYTSGSKFPSGGLCTAGYCVGNKITTSLLKKISTHISLCDNEATEQQYKILAKQLPSMQKRINRAYTNTLSFVTFIREILPTANINFVSSSLASQGFTPSVFSLDLPTKGDTLEEKETYKRALNLTLINKMITEIPDESKFCVSYGQLKGCYWTIPATSTQGTTKEIDKDYIVRVSMSPEINLALHKKVFSAFVTDIES